MHTFRRNAVAALAGTTVAAYAPPKVASANTAQVTDGHLPGTVASSGVAAAPPQGCRLDSYDGR
ncbi:hypothetical protein GCM10018779_58350 [Streptomyces griseocarneus]|nr:hypothetical protein GCM10018779_58350 [Streptomyces griseocarneus]